MIKIKKLFLLMLFCCFSVLTFYSCSEPASIYGNFSKDLYVLNIGEEIDFKSQLNLTGIDYQNIEIVFSNDKILEENQDKFVASASGQTYVFAKSGEMTIAQTQVIVNYVFSSPSIISISKDGVLQWEESQVNIDGKIVKANQYIIYVNGNRQFKVDDNKLDFAKQNFEYGRYQVEIKAVGIDSLYINESLTSQSKTVVYDYMSTIEGLNIEVSTNFLNQQATISWNEIENALYDVYLDGFKINERKLSSSSFTYDFERFSNGKQIKLEIIAYDSKNEKIQLSTEYILNKLYSVQPSYVYDEETGYLLIEDNQNASGYIVSYLDENDINNGQTIVNANEKEFLNDLPNGIYNISVQAVGGNKDNGYYLNSNSSQSFKFAKLAMPEPEIKIEDEDITITFDVNYDNYVNSYIVKVGEYKTIHNIEDGYQLVLNSSVLNDGENLLEIFALPTKDTQSSTGVKYYSQNGVTTNFVLTSKAYTYNVYKLKNIDNITHQFENESTKSQLIFNNITFADAFKIFVNDVQVPTFELEIGESLTTLTFDNLNSYLPNENNQYVIGIECYREDGKSINSFGTKTLTILSPVQKAEKLNGQYNWSQVEGQVEYKYTIYSSDESYQTSNFLLTENTNDLQLKENLPFGYYKIEIVSISTDTNFYLDSNFADSEALLKDEFLVYEQIMSPSVNFLQTESGFQLEISNVEYVGQYVIFLDGQEIDSFDVVNVQDSYTRNLVDQKFDLEKEYKIEVVAKPGSKYDNNLHTDSEKAIINVTRIAKPTFEIEELYSTDGLFGIEGEKGSKIAENIIPSNLNDSYGVDHYDILINGEKVNLNNEEKYNLINQSQTFNLSIIAKAKQQENNNYYLDSFDCRIVVERLNAPTNLDYQDEVVTYSNTASENVEKYFVELELFTGSGNRTINFFTDSTEQSFNLQQILENFANNNSFNNELKQTTKFGVRVWAYCQPIENENKLTLQSSSATTSGGGTQIIIEKMQATILSFDATESQNLLSWNAVGQNTVYDIYKNDLIVKEDYTGTSIALSSLLEENDFENGAIGFKIVSKNSKYLNSSASNVVYINKLNSLENISIAKNNNSWVAVLDISNTEQARRISKVLVNNEEISYTTGENKIYIDLSNYIEFNYTLNIILQSKNNQTEEIYYINSDLFYLNLKDIKDQSLNAQVKENKIVWTSPYPKWLEDQNLVSYKIVVLANDTELFINNYTTTEILLTELEDLTNSVFQTDKQISVSIYSQLSDYQTTTEQTLYYGEIEQTGIEIQKVADANNVEISIKLKETSDLIDAYQSSQVILNFDNIWEGDVSFDITINENESVFNNLTIDKPYENCSVSLSENKYTIYLNSQLLSRTDENKIYLRVNQQNLIPSNNNEFTILRNDDIQSASVDNHGILTVEYGELANNKLLIKMAVGQDIIYKEFVTSQNEIDLQELLKDKSGNIIIDIIVVDSELKILPSLNSYKIYDSKLAKIDSIEVLDNGQMYFNISSSIYVGEESQIEFIVKTENGEEIQFYPTRLEDNLFKYEYSLDKLAKILNLTQAGVYNLSFANREINYINSDFVDFEFGYSIEENEGVFKQRESLNKDYIIFKELTTENSGLSTVGFRFSVNNYLGQTIQQIDLMLSDGMVLSGYWDSNVNKFVENKPIYTEEEKNAKVYKCFAFSLNEIFDGIEYGVYSVDVVRIAKVEEIYTVFNQKTFSITKLNNVVEDILSPLNVNVYENNVVWNWQKPENDTLPQDFMPSAYYITIWPQNNEAQKQVYIVSSNKLDLTTINLTTGYNYINIQAVSVNENLLASSMLVNNLSVYKYGQTKGLKLENGEIVFDLSKDGVLDKTIDFVSVFDTSTNGTNLADNLSLIGENGFDDIYYFQTDSVDKQTIKLKFVSTDSSGQTENGKVYYAKVNALDLLSKFVVSSKDFVAQMYEYIEANKGSDSTTNFANLMAFYDKITTSAFGLTEYEVLFNDFGINIPSGYYNVSAIQTATNVYDDFVDSDPSKATLIYVASAPTVEMKNTYDSETGEELYTATYNCVDIVDDNGELNKSVSYVMAFRKVSNSSEEGIYKFEISYNNSWSIKYNNSYLEGIISGDDTSFTINFTAMGDYQIDEVYLIDKNFEYNVYVYAVGNSRSCYGKASTFNLVFLSLEKENILVQNGFINIITSKNEIGSDILVKYKKQYATGSETTEQIVQMQTDDQGKAVLNDILPEAGLYDYVIFNVMGQLNNDKKIMKLPSVSYGILNLYKLNNPILTTSNNQLIISAQNRDSDYGPFNFMIDLGNETIKSENQYFDKTLDNLSQLSFNHNENNYTILETTSVCFVSKSIENFVIDDYQNDSSSIPFFEKLVDFNGLIVVSSDSQEISLEKLNPVINLQLIKGNLTWDAVQRDDLQENIEIVYKIEVEYYDDGDSENIKATENFFTQNNYFDTSLVSSKYSQGIGKGFNFNIYVYVGQKVDELGLSLVEGGYFDISGSYQFESGKKILYSSATTKKELTKEETLSFYDKEGSIVQVYDGKVVLNRTEEDNFDFDIKLVDASNQKIDLVENEDYVIDRNGKINVEGNLSNLVYFITITNNDFANGQPFKLEIYTYSQTTIKSDPLTTNDMFKLKEISSEEVELKLQEEGETYKNVLSFEKYFENNKFYFSNQVYKIEVYSVLIMEEENILNYLGENFDLTSEKPIFETIDNFVEHSLVFIVKPVDINGSYLTSEEFIINFASFENLGNEISLSYNQGQYRFEWSTENDGDEYQFFIDLTYTDGEKEKAYITDAYIESTDKNIFIYQPNKMGSIEKVDLYVRNINSQNLQDQDLVLGLYQKVATISDVEYKLFASGSGTQLDPYVITTQEDFKNIALRDNANSQVYFKLNNNIDVEINAFNQFAISSFHGNLDGNGNTINVVMQMDAEVVENEDVNVEKNLTLGNTSGAITFNKSGSLFGTINKDASVYDLNINYSVDYSTIENLGNAFISGLAYQNFGSLTNISVGTIDLPISSNLSSIAVSGLVSINSGVIKDCQINASISKVLPQKAVTLIYGAIAITNENQGSIVGCVNNGNIDFNVRHAQAKVYIGGIVYENNASSILASGNNGTIATKGNYAYQSALAGIVVRNTSSQIDFVYNNGAISSSSTLGNNISGIIYRQQYGTVGTIFETSNSGVITISANGSVSMASGSKVYAYSNLTSIITNLEITSLTSLNDGDEFNYSSTYKILVHKTGDVYSISHEKL